MIAQKKRIDNGIQEVRKWTLGNTKASKDMSETNSDKAINMELYTERERGEHPGFSNKIPIGISFGDPCYGMGFLKLCRKGRKYCKKKN